MNSFHAKESLALHAWCQASKEGVLLVDQAGKVCLINPRLQDMLRLPAPPATANEMIRLSHPYVPELAAVLWPEDWDGRARWGALRIHKYPARRLSWRQVPLLEQGEMVGTLTIFEDSTNEEQFDLATQSFLSMISHDLRTPLSAILGFAELLYNNRGGLSDQEQEEFLEHILKNATHLSRYAQIALDIMYLEADLQNFDLEPIALGRFIDSWLSDALHRFPAEQIAYRNGAARDLVARISPAALHRILYILVEFALEESPPQSLVEIQVGCDEAQAHIVIQHRAPTLTAIEAAGLFKLMRSRDLSEAGRPQLHRMQLYVASLLVERQQGVLTFCEHHDGIYHFDLILPLASPVLPPAE